MLKNPPNDSNHRPCRVLVRSRPLTSKEADQSNPCYREKVVRKNQSTLYLYQPELSQSIPLKYSFDRIFLEDQHNGDVFEQLTQSIEDLLDGYNTAIMAYGMTGAGKSHTMFGGDSEQGLVSMVLGRIMAVPKIKVKVALSELYNEQLRDLLADNSSSLQILEDGQGSISIPDLSEHQLTKGDDYQQILQRGTSKRVTASTSSNLQSSRSHCIIQVSIERTQNEATTVSKLFLIDLAGSERATENRGVRLQEGSNINKSLLSLSNCITQLSENSSFVPYRDSKLTRLLKDCLGGNSKAIIIACISPSFISYEETANTLKYACKASKIKREILPNVKSDEAGELDFLRKEVGKLRHLLTIKDSVKTLSPQPRKESVWRTPRNVSPNLVKAKSKSTKENEELRRGLLQKDNELKQKDKVIQRLSKELSIYRNPSYCLQNKENYFSSNESKARRIEAKRHQIPLLQMVRQKTRPFKNKLKEACNQYQSLQDKGHLPLHLVEVINCLMCEYSFGSIVLSEESTKTLYDLKRRADLSLH